MKWITDLIHLPILRDYNINSIRLLDFNIKFNSSTDKESSKVQLKFKTPKSEQPNVRQIHH